MSSIDELNERWVTPYYLMFLGGNLHLHDEKQTQAFLSSLRRDRAIIEPQIVERLLRLTWREQLAGSWFAGLNRWRQFTGLIGESLLQSRTCYAGRGYCFALARFADETGVEYLRLYLDDYLPRTADQYDQDCAMGALFWLDEVHKTNYAQVYVQPDGLWEKFIAGKHKYGNWNIKFIASRFREVMEYYEDQIDS